MVSSNIQHTGIPRKDGYTKEYTTLPTPGAGTAGTIRSIQSATWVATSIWESFLQLQVILSQPIVKSPTGAWSSTCQ